MSNQDIQRLAEKWANKWNYGDESRPDVTFEMVIAKALTEATTPLTEKISTLEAQNKQLERDREYLVRCAENHSDARDMAEKQNKVLREALERLPKLYPYSEPIERLVEQALTTNQPDKRKGE